MRRSSVTPRLNPEGTMPQADFACKVGFLSRSQVEPGDLCTPVVPDALFGAPGGLGTLTP